MRNQHAAAAQLKKCCLFFVIPFLVLILSVIISLYQLKGELDAGSYIIAKSALLLMKDISTLSSDEEKVRKFRALLAQSGKVDIRPSDRLHISDKSTNKYLIIAPKEALTDLIIYRPVILWFHGGGFALGSAETDEGICRSLVEATGFIVIAVNYRLAPESKYPAAADDALEALRWAHRNAESFGGDSRSIFVAGESAGGNLAVSLVASSLDGRFRSRDIRHPVAGLVAIYPCLEDTMERESHSKYREFSGTLTLELMRWFWELYIPKAAGGKHRSDTIYRAFPLRTPARILRQFPRTIVVLAKHDILLDEGLALAELLRSQSHRAASKWNESSSSSGVDLLVYNTSVHGFFGKPVFAAGRQAVLDVADRLREMVE